jgi:type I restriction enzyme R subunit
MNRPNPVNRPVGKRENQTQKRMPAFFQDALGYAYLGHWKDRTDNANVEEALLAD